MKENCSQESTDDLHPIRRKSVKKAMSSIRPMVKQEVDDIPLLVNQSTIKQESLDIQQSENQPDIIVIERFVKEPKPLNLGGIEAFFCPLSDVVKACPVFKSERDVRQHIEFTHVITIGTQKKLSISIRKQIL